MSERTIALAARRVTAREDGIAAYEAGKPCQAPSLGRGEMEALWRLGWKYAAARAEARDWSEKVRV